jgi:hypothetical protein
MAARLPVDSAAEIAALVDGDPAEAGNPSLGREGGFSGSQLDGVLHVVDGEPELERRPLVQRRLERQRSAVLLMDDRARDRGTLARAAPDLLGGEERVEHARDEIVPTLTATIRESIRLATSRPGLRRCTSMSRPAMSDGYTAR